MRIPPGYDTRVGLIVDNKKDIKHDQQATHRLNLTVSDMVERYQSHEQPITREQARKMITDRLRNRRKTIPMRKGMTMDRFRRMDLDACKKFNARTREANVANLVIPLTAAEAIAMRDLPAAHEQEALPSQPPQAPAVQRATACDTADISADVPSGATSGECSWSRAAGSPVMKHLASPRTRARAHRIGVRRGQRVQRATVAQASPAELTTDDARDGALPSTPARGSPGASTGLNLEFDSSTPSPNGSAEAVEQFHRIPVRSSPRLRTTAPERERREPPVTVEHVWPSPVPQRPRTFGHGTLNPASPPPAARNAACLPQAPRTTTATGKSPQRCSPRLQPRATEVDPEQTGDAYLQQIANRKAGERSFPAACRLVPCRNVHSRAEPSAATHGWSVAWPLCRA